jgi:hypothetical protein
MINPKRLNSLDRIAYQDEYAARTIAECQAMIDLCTQHRQALAARYGELETMTYSDRLTLNREPATSWHSVRYNLTITRKYSDGTEAEQLTEQFTGKERAAALKRFEQLRRERPGIEAIKQIEKSQWER